MEKIQVKQQHSSVDKVLGLALHSLGCYVVGWLYSVKMRLDDYFVVVGTGFGLSMWLLFTLF